MIAYPLLKLTCLLSSQTNGSQKTAGYWLGLCLLSACTRCTVARSWIFIVGLYVDVTAARHLRQLHQPGTNASRLAFIVSTAQTRPRLITAVRPKTLGRSITDTRQSVSLAVTAFLCPFAWLRLVHSTWTDLKLDTSLPVFKNRLKTYLFRRCYETVWLWITFLFLSHYLPSRTVVPAIVFTV